MKFLIDDEIQEFTELKAFRAEYGLPDTFSVFHFEPKDYTGLGSIEHAGGALHQLRQSLLAKLPVYRSTAEWLDFAPSLDSLFRDQLEAVNDHIGLREPEIGFAAAGFGDVGREWIYALIHAEAAHKPAPNFNQVYIEWLFSTVRVSQRVFHYPHQGEEWVIQLVTHAYGRMGMIIKQGSQIHYVYDAGLACPAEGFMVELLREVAARIAAAINPA